MAKLLDSPSGEIRYNGIMGKERKQKKFDFKKEYHLLYRPSCKTPEIVDVPAFINQDNAAHFRIGGLSPGSLHLAKGQHVWHNDIFQI